MFHWNWLTKCKEGQYSRLCLFAWHSVCFFHHVLELTFCPMCFCFCSSVLLSPPTPDHNYYLICFLLFPIVFIQLAVFLLIGLCVCTLWFLLIFASFVLLAMCHSFLALYFCLFACLLSGSCSQMTLCSFFLPALFFVSLYLCVVSESTAFLCRAFGSSHSRNPDKELWMTLSSQQISRMQTLYCK